MKKLINRAAALSILSLALSGALLTAVTLSATPAPATKPAPAAAQAPASSGKLTASNIQINRMGIPEELLVPETFRVATYENVIIQVTKTKKFQHVYRDGDRTAADAPDLVIVNFIPQAYTAGSQKKREVTTVKGATSIKVKVQFTSRDGKVLLEKDLEGKVRFFGENLRATYDLAKKVAATINASF
jgi:hypothetical protein